MEQTKELTAAQIKSELAGYTGTTAYHRNPFYADMVYTDGAKAFAEIAGAYWLIDYIGLEIFSAYRDSPLTNGFGVVTVKVSEDSRATVTLEDGNDNQVKRKRIEFADLPQGEFNFFIAQADERLHVLMLPREY